MLPEYRTSFLIVPLLLCLIANDIMAGNEDSAYGLTSFTFASYLGSGFYTTQGQDVFVLQVPLHYTIKARTDYAAGWKLNLPVTIGFINFSGLRDMGLDNLPEINDVATLSFLPGVEYEFPVTATWTIIPFVDYGIARDLSNNTNILMTGAGIKSYANFHIPGALLTLGNRFLYARELNRDTGANSDFSLIETGLNYRVTSNASFGDGPVFLNYYYINFYYPDDLVFLERTDNPIHVSIENEAGITVSNLPDFLFFKKPEFGLGIRLGNDVKVLRLLFSAPF